MSIEMILKSLLLTLERPAVILYRYGRITIRGIASSQQSIPNSNSRASINLNVLSLSIFPGTCASAAVCMRNTILPYGALLENRAFVKNITMSCKLVPQVLKLLLNVQSLDLRKMNTIRISACHYDMNGYIL